jgi:hypothetical protein
MMFYEYLLNVDTTIYTTEIKEKSLFDTMVIKLEDVKKLLAILKDNLKVFGDIEPNLIDYIEK